jgi:hypothetical protein
MPPHAHSPGKPSSMWNCNSIQYDPATADRPQEP